MAEGLEPCRPSSSRPLPHAAPQPHHGQPGQEMRLGTEQTRLFTGQEPVTSRRGSDGEEQPGGRGGVMLWGRRLRPGGGAQRPRSREETRRGPDTLREGAGRRARIPAPRGDVTRPRVRQDGRPRVPSSKTTRQAVSPRQRPRRSRDALRAILTGSGRGSQPSDRVAATGQLATGLWRGP